MSATPLTRPTRVTVDMAAMYAAAKDSRSALLAYLADAGATLAELRSELATLESEVAIALSDTSAVEGDMLRMNAAWAAADGITPPAPVTPDAPATPPSRTPAPATAGNRPSLDYCVRKMSNRSVNDGSAPSTHIHAPALCMLKAAAHENLRVAGIVSTLQWAYDATPRAEADMAAKAAWYAAGLVDGDFRPFALACWRLARTRGANVTPRDVLLAFDGGDTDDTALALAQSLA